MIELTLQNVSEEKMLALLKNVREITQDSVLPLCLADRSIKHVHELIQLAMESLAAGTWNSDLKRRARELTDAEIRQLREGLQLLDLDFETKLDPQLLKVIEMYRADTMDVEENVFSIIPSDAVRLYRLHKVLTNFPVTPEQLQFGNMVGQWSAANPTAPQSQGIE